MVFIAIHRQESAAIREVDIYAIRYGAFRQTATSFSIRSIVCIGDVVDFDLHIFKRILRKQGMAKTETEKDKNDW